MTYLITLLDSNGKYTVYIGGDIHGLYRYLDIIGAPNKFITSGQCSHNFRPSSFTNNDTASTQPVIADLCMRQKIICELCEKIGHKYDVCIIRGPKSLPTSLRINMNQFNTLHGNETNEPPREWNTKPP